MWFGEETVGVGASETIETSPFVSVGAAEAVLLRGMPVKCWVVPTRGTVRW